MTDWGSVDREKYMTRAEASKELDTPVNRIKPLIDKGILKGLQRGKFWYVERASVQRLKESGMW